MLYMKKTVFIMFGSMLVAAGVNVFLIHHQLLDGGTFGVGLIFHYLTGVKVGLVAILLSLPVFSFVWFYNRTFFFNSLHGMFFSSFLIDLSYHPLVNFGDSFDQNPMMSSIVGGVLIGSGIGLMLRVETSIGGTDLLGQIVASYADLNPGMVIFLIDLVIIFTGTVFIEGSSLFHSLVTVICVGIMTSIISAGERKALS